MEKVEKIQIKPKAGSVKPRTRRGRGNSSGLGGESGRGHKGQKSRTGYSRKQGFEGGQTPLIRRLPKKKGFKNPGKITYIAINLDLLERISNAGDIVNLNYLIEKGIIKRSDDVKILSQGELKKKITLEFSKFSKTALEKIQKSGSIIKKL